MGPQKTGESLANLANFSCPALNPKDPFAKELPFHTHFSLIQSLEAVILHPGCMSESSVEFLKDQQVILMHN